MKKSIIIAFMIISGFMFFSSCSNPSGQNDKTTQTATTGKVLYVCPMHPEETSDKPGKCPKCGMDLVKKEVRNDTAKIQTQGSTKK